VLGLAVAVTVGAGLTVMEIVLVSESVPSLTVNSTSYVPAVLKVTLCGP
jgi:hypothetical protein